MSPVRAKHITLHGFSVLAFLLAPQQRTHVVGTFAVASISTQKERDIFFVQVLIYELPTMGQWNARRCYWRHESLAIVVVALFLPAPSCIATLEFFS